MKILFIGTVEFSRRCLRALRAAGHDPALVVTMPETDGRTRHSDWADLSAEAEGIEVKRWSDLTHPADRAFLVSQDFDLVLVCGWSRLLPTYLAPNMVGSHPTMLPKGRGRHPIPWSIILGNGEWSGLTFFRLVAEPDAGPILWQRSLPREIPETQFLLHASHVYERVCWLGEYGIGEVVRRVEVGDSGMPQDEARAFWWPKRCEEDNRVDWTRAETAARLVRAMSRPYGGAWSEIQKAPEKILTLGASLIRWWRVNSWNSHGLIAPPGTVQGVFDEVLYVATGDGWVAFSEWTLPEGHALRPGMRLS